MTSRGWKLPHEFYVQRIIQKIELSMAKILRKETYKLKNQLAQLQVAKEKPMTSFVESICALPFDRSLYIVPFPRDMEVPKYDKYAGNGDPHDNV